MKNVNKDIRSLRTQYDKGVLSENHLNEDPFAQFHLWMDEALKGGVNEPHAMNLATVDETGRVSSRIVLLRNLDENGFVFFTNYKSPKGKDLDSGRMAALNFFWPEVQRQVRIEGISERVNSDDSDEYFDSRPFDSKIGALASDQSGILDSRETLESKFNELKKQFETENVKRPEYWGGYRLIPDLFEFWQGRLNRLHDRFQFKKQNGEWSINRLFP